MKPIVTILSVTIAVLLVAVVAVVFMFGTPQASVPAVAQQDVPATMRLPGTDPLQEPQAATPVDGKVPKADPNSPLAIQIPGCVCHSDDPNLVEQHSAYRMNQCAGCHAGQTPTGM
jgi:hypothetical protein